MKRRNTLSICVLSVALLAVTSCSSNAGTQENTSERANATESVENADPTKIAVVEVENDTYDFGVVEEGEKVKHEFIFTNTGEAPLIINSVRASCGCTTPNYPKEPIKPGEQSKIEVVFDSSNQPGMQHKVITMLSNIKDSQTVFHLKGQVK